MIISTTALISRLSSKARPCFLLRHLVHWRTTTYRACCCLMQRSFNLDSLMLATAANLFQGRWWIWQLSPSKASKSSMTLNRVFLRRRLGSSSAGCRTLRTKFGWTTSSETRSRTQACSSSSVTRCRSIFQGRLRTTERTDSCIN